MNGSDATAVVVRRHVDAVRCWRMPDMVDDYADDAVVLVRGMAIRGKPAIRALFEQAQTNSGLTIDSETFAGPVGQVVYHNDSLRFASDTFVVHDGKIVCQTIAFLAA